MSVIDHIKSKCCDAVVSHCSEKGCTLKLTGLSNFVILKGEKLSKNRKICDHVIFIGNDRTIIVIVEFKSRNARPSEIEKKFTNCSTAALDILEKCDSPQYEFYHIVIVRNWRPHEYRKIVNMSLAIRGKRYPIIPLAKEVSLSDVLSRFQY